MKGIGSWIAAAFALWAAPATACSVASTYRVPTNLELTERADTIILGVVERALPGRDNDLGEVVIRPTTLLKGGALPAEVRLEGYLSNEGGRAVPSDPGDLMHPNPGALTGYCKRYVFDRGMLLLLFLERRDGVLGLAGYPFARSAEDVPSPDAPWVKAVRLYAEIAALPQPQRRPALMARRDLLRFASDTDSKLLAEDIDRQLKGKRIPPYD